MAATGENKPTTSIPSFDVGTIEEATERIRKLNERLIESAKSAGQVALDAYEKSLQSLVDFDQKVAGASQLDWVTALATTHAKFIQDVSASFTKAAREVLK